MPTKLRIKYGSVELDYEGELAFEKSDVFSFLETLSSLAAPVENQVNDHVIDTGSSGNGRDSVLTSVESVADIAQRLGVNSGPELAIAACAALHFINNRAQFESKDISAVMREAQHFFKEGYASNLSKTLTRLVRAGTLRSIGSGRYALSHDAIEDLKKRLA